MSKRKVPTWAIEIFEDFMERDKNLSQVLAISIRGICGLRGLPELSRALAALNDDIDHWEIRLHEHHSLLAKSEIENDFPALRSQYAVMLWANLEAFIRNLFCGILKNMPEKRSIDSFNNIKISLNEYDLMDDEDKIAYLIDKLEEKLGYRSHPGIGRFELIFKAFEMHTPINTDTQRTLLELFHTRNVIMHRIGRADKKFIKNCPWLDYKIDQRIVVKKTDLEIYSQACLAYLFEIAQRIRVMLNLDRYTRDSNRPDHEEFVTALTITNSILEEYSLP